MHLTLIQLPFDVRIILFQAAEAFTCQGVTQLFISCSLLRVLAIFSPEKNMFFLVAEEA